MPNGLASDVNQVFRYCVESINSFAILQNSTVDTDVTELQQRFIVPILVAVRERAIERAHLFSKDEVVRALLHAGPGYDTLDSSVGGLALSDPARLSVPDSAVDSVSLAYLLRADAGDCVCRSELVKFGSSAKVS